MTDTIFFRLLTADDKAAALANAVTALREGQATAGVSFIVDSRSFQQVPGSPFAYWVSEAVRQIFPRLPGLEDVDRLVRSTNPLNEDVRYIRTAWEVSPGSVSRQGKWVPLAKGGQWGPYSADLHLVIAWDDSERSYRGFKGTVNRPLTRPASLDFFFRPGLTWPRRTSGLSFRVLPRECIFGDKGPALFVCDDQPEMLLALASILSITVPLLARSVEGAA